MRRVKGRKPDGCRKGCMRGMTQVLPIQRMESETFRPFGELVPLDSSAHSFEINRGRAIRHFDIATVDVDARLERAFVSVFAAQPHPDAFEIEMLERHPLGSQAFIPCARPTG